MFMEIKQNKLLNRPILLLTNRCQTRCTGNPSTSTNENAALRIWLHRLKIEKQDTKNTMPQNEYQGRKARSFSRILIRKIFTNSISDHKSSKIFRNPSTVHSSIPLKECNHLFASPAKENENKLSLTASSGTPAIFTVLQISMYVARCA